MKNNKKEKIALILLGAMLVTNPLTNQYLLRFIDWALIGATKYTVWITLAASAYIVGLLGFYMWQSRSVVKTTPKGKKTKTQAYIPT